MKTNKGKSFFKSESFKAGMASLGLAFAVLFSTLFLFVVAIGESITEGNGIVGFMVFVLVAYYIALAVCCYVIVKKNPGSFWFVPLVCNGFTIVGLMSTSFWEDSRLILAFGSALVISIIASIIGTLDGRRRIIPKSDKR